MDITLAVVINPPAHTLDSKKEGARWKRGTIANIYKSSDIAQLVDGKYVMDEIGSKRMGFIHVRNVPGQTLRRIQDVMTETQEDGDGKMLRRTRFRLEAANIPAGARSRFLTDKQITVDWSVAKAYIVKDINDAPIKDADL